MQKAAGYEVWVGESLPSVTRLMGHKTTFQIHVGQFTSRFHREFETNRFAEFEFSFVKVVNFSLSKPCGSYLSEKYCSPQTPFPNVKMVHCICVLTGLPSLKNKPFSYSTKESGSRDTLTSFYPTGLIELCQTSIHFGACSNIPRKCRSIQILFGIAKRHIHLISPLRA